MTELSLPAGARSGRRARTATATGVPDELYDATPPAPGTRVAVIIPCLNEGRTIAKVVADFRRELPGAGVYVVDNASTDDTALRASGAGATVIREPRRGKGFAIRAAFRDVDADVYVLADGDDQTPSERVHELIAPIADGRADMVVGSRALTGRTSEKKVNDLGNVIFSTVLRLLLGVRMTDVLSGYRALSRHLVKGLPLAARNFEVEVELTVKTTQRSYRIVEIPVEARPRGAGGHPRLRVVGDGLRILWAIGLLYRDYRPMSFFGLAGALLVGAGVAVELVPGATDVGPLPGPFVASLLAIAGFLSICTGAILSVLARRFTELEGKVDIATQPARFSPGAGPDAGA